MGDKIIDFELHISRYNEEYDDEFEEWEGEAEFFNKADWGHQNISSTTGLVARRRDIKRSLLPVRCSNDGAENGKAQGGHSETRDFSNTRESTHLHSTGKWDKVIVVLYKNHTTE